MCVCVCVLVCVLGVCGRLKLSDCQRHNGPGTQALKPKLTTSTILEGKRPLWLILSLAGVPSLYPFDDRQDWVRQIHRAPLISVMALGPVPYLTEITNFGGLCVCVCVCVLSLIHI